MDAKIENPAELMRRSQLAKDQGKQWLAAGAGVGAIGALGALIGAVCPLCVVMTPALLIAGAARDLGEGAGASGHEGSAGVSRRKRLHPHLAS